MAEPGEVPRRRTWPRRVAIAAALLLVGYGGAVAFGLPPSMPFDAVISVAPVAIDPALRAPDDGKRRLVVLVHGLWRSPWALWRHERALRAHGYEVLNFGYPSTAGTIEQHADRLQQAVARHCGARGRPDAVAFVGHSLGGLVIAEYLRRPTAQQPWACVFLGTPHRGAVLADLRRHWWLFRLVMGTAAALQLSPGDPLHRRPIPHPCPIGTVVGNLGDGNRSIPGDDDGTVGVREAHLHCEDDAIELPLGHTRLGFADAAVQQVLNFLRVQHFSR